MYASKTKQKSLDEEELSVNQRVETKRKLKCTACTPQKQQPIKVYVTLMCFSCIYCWFLDTRRANSLGTR